MNSDQTAKYIELLEHTLALLEQKQGFQQKLIEEAEGTHRETCLSKIRELDDRIGIRLEQLKRLKSGED